MTRQEGRKRNTNDAPTITRVPINSVSAVTLAAANPDRFHIEVWLASGIVDRQAIVRVYPAADDNNLDGALLIMRTLGNDNLLQPCWKSPTDNPYTGEISGISTAGTFDLIVMEW